MEFMESTHAKLIRALVGAQHSWYSLRYCLLDIWLIFYSSWWYTWICFVFIVEPTLLPIKAHYLPSRYALRHLIFKIPRISMFLRTMSMFDVILVCIDTCLIIFDEMHAEWYTFQTNLWCLLMVLKKRFGYAYQLSFIVIWFCLACYVFGIILINLGILD